MIAPSIDIVIVNWNAGASLQRCVESISDASLDGIDLRRVVIVDNASTDGSPEGLHAKGLPLRILRNQRNRGFGAACNQGATGSDATYLLFLNPDTCLSANSLRASIEFMQLEESKRFGIVGVQLADVDGNVSRTCARFPTPGMFFAKMLGLDRILPGMFPSHFMTEWDHATSREVDQVMGAFFFVRRSVYDALAGFDERFFVYFEEVDFALRARSRGWSTYYLSHAQVYHEGGGTTKQIRPARLFYSLRSRILYAYKHFGWWRATAVLVGTMLLEPVSRVASATLRGAFGESVTTLKAYAMTFRSMPTTLRTAWRSEP